jgi:hypothetical protein
MGLFSRPLQQPSPPPKLDSMIQALCKREIQDVNQCLKVQRPIVYELPPCSPLIYDYIVCQEQVVQAFIKGKVYSR